MSLNTKGTMIHRKSMVYTGYIPKGSLCQITKTKNQ